MSRICVKNLPKYVVEDRLREFFSQKGEITDVKLMRTKDGKSRQFAFIGFRTNNEAQEAIRYFNRSYLDTSRITCEVAQKLGDANLPRPWSQHSTKKDNKATTPDANKHAGAKGQVDNSKDIVDPELQDFIQVMQPRAKSKLWANDTSIVSNARNKERKSALDAVHLILGQSVSSADEIPNNPEPNKSCELAHGVISDMDYFKSKVTSEWSDSESSSNEDDNDNNDSACTDDDTNCSDASGHEGNCSNIPSERTLISGAQELDLNGREDTSGEDVANDKAQVNAAEESGQLPNPQDENGVFDSCRLFVRNLPYVTIEEELEEHFSQFGSVSEVHLVVEKETRRSKGRAYVHFSAPEFAARALKELDNTSFQGRLLRVMPAIQRTSDNTEKNVSMDDGSKTLKQQREEERKASEASGDTRAWNRLYMRSDTVVENIAREYGVSKGDLLDREADDLAVLIALGETQVISETKKAFKNAGVNVESLEELANGKSDGLKRSNHVLLVKNLPYSSTENELANMFGRFGSLDKIILPRTKTLALVVFLEAVEAKSAYKGLAYKHFKDAPLYLEWAPSNILSPTSKINETNNGIGENDVKRMILEQNVEKISDVDIDSDRIEARSLFVKNLNFKTTDESLRNYLSEHMKEGRILNVKVKKHLKNGKNVSMGFGFVEFDSTETATNVCTGLQRTVLDGHALILQLCHGKSDGKVQKTVEKDKSSTKLLVKNVAFEVTKKDLKQLFSPFGQIKSLRLPLKFGSHRGFAFVEYVTQQEAQNALAALSSTHLYGRHLVIERAKEGESLEDMRARSAVQLNENNGYVDAAKISRKRKLISTSHEGNMKFKH